MTDPSISAARKVFTEYWPDQGDFEFNYSNEGRFGIEVAREMAKSVQELHRPTHVAHRRKSSVSIAARSGPVRPLNGSTQVRN